MSEQSYTVYEPDEVKEQLVEQADELVFIKDGFAFWAMIFPIFWLMYHRLWLPLVGFIVVLGILQILAYLFEISQDSQTMMFVGISFAFGFLANDIRRIVLERRDYQLVGAVAGVSQLECERRFFDNWSPLVSGLQYEEAK